MSDALREVAELVLRESGVVIRESQLPALRAAVARVAPGLDAEGLLEQAAQPAARTEIVERLIDEVTIKETFFLRHREELDTIDWRALAAHAATAGRPRVRVWSAACASGEEAYSLAVLALEVFAPGHAPVEILATDIAHSALARAAAGRYGARSLRHVDAGLRERWFAPTDAGLEVGAAPRALVRFARHNLLSDPIPPAGEGAFDLIVCRNVLIYFRPEAVRATIGRLRAGLTPGGMLLLGAADRLTTDPEPAARPDVPRRASPRRRVAATPRRQRRPVAPAPAAAAPDATADLERGMVALAEGEHAVAVEALRRSLYLEPGNAIAAFQLARAHEARGDRPAARRAYWQALALLEDAAEEVGGVARDDLATAARARLDTLGAG